MIDHATYDTYGRENIKEIVGLTIEKVTTVRACTEEESTDVNGTNRGAGVKHEVTIHFTNGTSLKI